MIAKNLTEERLPFNESSWSQSHRNQLKKLIVYPGSIEEYEKFRGHEVEVIDTGLNNKCFYFDREGFCPLVFDSLFKNDIEAIVHAHVTSIGSSTDRCIIYGLPVKKSD